MILRLLCYLHGHVGVRRLLEHGVIREIGCIRCKRIHYRRYDIPTHEMKGKIRVGG